MPEDGSNVSCHVKSILQQFLSTVGNEAYIRIYLKRRCLMVGNAHELSRKKSTLLSTVDPRNLLFFLGYYRSFIQTGDGSLPTRRLPQRNLPRHTHLINSNGNWHYAFSRKKALQKNYDSRSAGNYYCFFIFHTSLDLLISI